MHRRPCAKEGKRHNRKEARRHTRNMAAGGRKATKTTTRDLKDGRVRLELWLDGATKEELARLAFDQGRPISAVVGDWIRRGLEESKNRG